MDLSRLLVADEQFDLVTSNDFRIVRYADLLSHFQESIAWFFAMDNEIWPLRVADGPMLSMDEIDAFLEECRRTGRNPRHDAFRESLPGFVQLHGDVEFGVVDIAIDDLKSRVVDSLAGRERLSGMDWSSYHSWYQEKAVGEGTGRLRAWPAENRWPVFLSADASAVMDDGWHRFHSYARAGHADIPAVFLPSDRHRAHLLAMASTPSM